MNKINLMQLSTYLSLVIVISLLPINSYGATTSYTCRFSLMAEPKGLSKPISSFDLQFVVDASTGKAYILGNAGSSEVQLVLNDYGVSFLEITNSGNIMSTTITNSGEAVHSRNGIMFKELVPSQYYGKCTQK